MDEHTSSESIEDIPEVNSGLHEIDKYESCEVVVVSYLFQCDPTTVICEPPPTCPADLDSDCGSDDLGKWEGEFFPGIPKIKYEGPTSKNPLAYKWYNANEEILGKNMKDWMRFSVAFWHTFRGTGGDPFGAATKMWPWEGGTNSLAMVIYYMPGYERLCCLRCIQPRDHNFQTTCVCRVPRNLREENVIECVHCSCKGCASGD